MTIVVESPYLLFLGDVSELAAAKTAAGIAYWRPECVLGQYRLPRCSVDLGLRDLAPADAARVGARTMIIGIANAGGFIPETWLPAIEQALRAGLDVAAGMHARLNRLAGIKTLADRLGRRLVDVREPGRSFPVATGLKRAGRRVLTVGTDCAIGKKYTALALTRDLRALGASADFRATGQTGILISGEGVPLDAVVADFIAGAAEVLSPAAEPHHWDVIEGQGSLFHPAYAGVTLGLIHGSQPDALVVCHEPGRRTLVGFSHPMPDVLTCIEHSAAAARLTNPACRVVGVSLNCSRLDEQETRAAIDKAEDDTGLPCADPVKHGMAGIARSLLASCN